MRFDGIGEILASSLLGGSILILALLYLLRGRRTKLVSGTYAVWSMLMGRSKVDFRALASLLLELMAAAALCLALTRPVLQGSAEKRKACVAILVDQGVTSRVVQGGKSGFAESLEVARAVLNEIPDDVGLLVAGLGKDLHVVSSPWQDRKAASAGLAGLVSEPHASRPLAVATKACRLLRAWTNAEQPIVIYIGDADMPEADLEGGCRLVSISVSKTTANMAVTRFIARRKPGFGRGYRLFVRVDNFSPKKKKAVLTVYSPAAIYGSEQVDVAPYGFVERAYVLDEEGGSEGRLVAELKALSGGPVDGFGLDDARYALVPKGKRIDTILVTAGNLFLSKAISVNPAVSLETVPPEKLQSALAKRANTHSPPDVMVFDDVPAPPELPGSLLLFGPKAAASAFNILKNVDTPIIESWNVEHPLLENVRLNDLQIRKAVEFDPGPEDTGIAWDTDGRAVMIARGGPRDQRKVFALGFGVTDSDLPLKVAFPVILANFMDWCVQAEKKVAGGEIEVGGFHAIGMGLTNPSAIQVKGPGDSRIEVVTRAGGPSIEADTPGFYDIVYGDTKVTLAANYNDFQASKLAAKARGNGTTLKAASEELKKNLGHGGDEPDKPLEKLLLAFALGLCCVLWIGHGTGLLH